MHEHDRDLIMALAEDSLVPKAVAAAETEIAACEECSGGLTLQRVAIEALHTAPAAALSEFESARIRRNVKSKLGIAAEPVPVASPSRRFGPLAVLGGTAAILLTVVLASGALQNLSGIDSADDFRLAEAADTTAAPATTAAAAVPESADDPVFSNKGAGADLDDAAVDVPTTTAAPAATTSPPQEMLELFAAISALGDLTTLRDVAVEQAGDSDLSRVFALQQFADSAAYSPIDELLDCGQHTDVSIPGMVYFFTIAAGEIDDTNVVAIAYITDPIEDSVVIAHDVDTCEPIAQSP